MGRGIDAQINWSVAKALRLLTKKENFDFKLFSRTMSWLEEHRFYLLPDMCEELNELRQAVEGIRDQVLDPQIVRPLYGDFQPYAEMNESYFIIEEE